MAVIIISVLLGVSVGLNVMFIMIVISMGKQLSARDRVLTVLQQYATMVKKVQHPGGNKIVN